MLEHSVKYILMQGSHAVGYYDFYLESFLIERAGEDELLSGRQANTLDRLFQRAVSETFDIEIQTFELGGAYYIRADMEFDLDKLEKIKDTLLTYFEEF